MLRVRHPRKYNAVMRTIERLPHGWIPTWIIAKQAGISILEIKHYLKLAHHYGIMERRKPEKTKMMEWKKIEEM